MNCISVLQGLVCLLMWILSVDNIWLRCAVRCTLYAVRSPGVRCPRTLCIQHVHYSNKYNRLSNGPSHPQDPQCSNINDMTNEVRRCASWSRFSGSSLLASSSRNVRLSPGCPHIPLHVILNGIWFSKLSATTDHEHWIEFERVLPPCPSASLSAGTKNLASVKRNIATTWWMSMVPGSSDGQWYRHIYS